MNTLDQEKHGNTAKWESVKVVSSLTATNLNNMGVKYSDVGGFVDKNEAMTSVTFPVVQTR